MNSARSAGTRTSRLTIALLLGLGLEACDVSNPCPGGGWRWDSEARACRAVVDSGMTSADAGDAGDAGDASVDAGSDSGAPSSIGSVCTTATQAADCLVTATYCAQAPGAPAGYCTVRDCTLSPDDCPGGYRCTAAFVMFGAPRFCEVIPADAGP